MCVPWELNPWPIALLTQCSTTEPQEHLYHEILRKKSELRDVNVQLREKNSMVEKGFHDTKYF